MAGLEDTSNFISDDTMAGLPSVIHSEEDDNSINNTGHDMFETTMIPTFTSTQLATPSDEEVNILQQHDTFTQLEFYQPKPKYVLTGVNIDQERPKE